MSLKNGLRWSDFKCIIKSLKVKNSKDLKLIGWDTKKAGVGKVRIGDLLCLRRIGTRMREVVDNFFFLTVEFSVYFSSKPFIRCVGYRCFLSPCSLCFWPLTRTVAEQVFNFDDIHLISLFLLWIVLLLSSPGILSRDPENFIFLFFLEGFRFLYFAFTFWVNFFKRWENRFWFILCLQVSTCSTAHLLKKVFPPLNCFCPLSGISWTSLFIGLSLGSPFCPSVS